MSVEEYLKENDFLPNKYGNFIYEYGSHRVNLSHYLTEFAQLYANQKLDEAAENATVKMDKSRYGCKMVVDKQSILNLKDKI